MIRLPSIRGHLYVDMNGDNQIDKRNCLIGLDIPFYMNTKALVDGELSNGANSSLVAPFSTYYLDSLVLYDSVFTAWKNQCLK